MAVSDHQLGHGLQPLGRLLAHRLVQFPVPPLALAAAIGDHWQIDSRALSTDSLFVEELNCVWHVRLRSSGWTLLKRRVLEE